MSKDKKRSNTETARRIWLAGIGAYGRAFTEAQEALKDVSGKSSDVFDELVQKGEFIEMAVGQKSKDMISKAGVPDFDIDDRIKAMRSRLSGQADLAENSDIEDRLSAVESKLETILELLNATQTTAKPKPKKKTATRAKTQRTPKK